MLSPDAASAQPACPSASPTDLQYWYDLGFDRTLAGTGGDPDGITALNTAQLLAYWQGQTDAGS